MNPLNFIKRILYFCKKINPLKTIYWNFKLLPFPIAIHIPIYIGYKVSLINVNKYNFKIKTPTVKRGMIQIGITWVPIFPVKGIPTMVRLSGGTITINGKLHIYTGCSLISSNQGLIEFGDDIAFNMYSLIYCNSHIKIGNHVRVGWMSQIYDSNCHFMVDTDTGEIKRHNKAININNNVWLGNHVTVGPGSAIPAFTTVAANSLVNKDFSTIETFGNLIVGIPGKLSNPGKIRIINNSIEQHLKQVFDINPTLNCIDISKFGFSKLPFDGSNNILYRSE